MHRLLHAGWLSTLLFAAALCVFDIASGMPGRLPLAAFGSVQSPLATWWNLAGCIAPGLALALFAFALERPLHAAGAGRSGRIGSTLLLLAGLLFAAQGLFRYDLDAPDDGAAQLHVLMLSLQSFAFLPAAVLLPWSLRRARGWRMLQVGGPVLLLGTLACLVAPGEVLRAIGPGVVQRAMVACQFGWIALASVTALRASKAGAVKLGSPH